MRKPKIVFIGAGSMSFGLPTFRDLFTCRELEGSTLALVDIDRTNLDRMAGLANRLNRDTGMDLRIEATTERRDVLAGADFVVSSIAVERCELWKHDFLIPKKYGVRHTLGENGGPGALFFTLRTLPMIMDIVSDMEALCPDAYFLNFSNPETRIVLAVGLYSRIRCVGLCHGIFMARAALAHMLKRPPESVSLFGAGMNHFQWLLSVRDAETGCDLYPAYWEADKAFDPSFMPYTRFMARAFGLWPTCSDDHLGEYQGYGYEAGEHGYNFEADAAERVKMAENIRDMTRDGAPESFFRPSGEQAVELIRAIHFNRTTAFPSGIVLNNGAITNLPANVAVEVPIVADASGIRAVHVGEMPPGPAGLMSQQIGPQQLSVLAALKGSRELALQALLCDPVIQSTDAAVKLLDDLWEINKPYIRACI